MTAPIKARVLNRSDMDGSTFRRRLYTGPPSLPGRGGRVVQIRYSTLLSVRAAIPLWLAELDLVEPGRPKRCPLTRSERRAADVDVSSTRHPCSAEPAQDGRDVSAMARRTIKVWAQSAE